MTQMGLVTMVLLAPATIEDQKLTTKLLSAKNQPTEEAMRDGACGGANAAHTVIRTQHPLALVVDGEPYSPGWQIAQYDGTQTSVHAPQTLIFPYNLGCTCETIVHLGLAHVAAAVEMRQSALCLELCLDDIQGTGHYT